ncbi:MAG TPA: hypothetical protein VMT32_19915 [Bryobacteraceae bacterium]|nr:hypothetical protein [Bryobacteraceae bacterium]
MAQVEPNSGSSCAAYETSALGFDADSVVDCILETLLAAKIFLGRLNRYVAQQKLDLVQLPSGVAAQTGAGPADMPHAACPSLD